MNHTPLKLCAFAKLRFAIRVASQRRSAFRRRFATTLAYLNTFDLLHGEGLRGVFRDNIGIILQKILFVNRFLKIFSKKFLWSFCASIG